MTPPSVAAAGLKRVRTLLGPPRQAATAPVVDGYLDLLVPADEVSGALDPASPGRAQRLMLTRGLPRVYERWWRPALGRLAKGVLGAGMEDERRMARLLLELQPGASVLDIACGTGAFTRDFAAAVGPGALVVGLDASPTMLARAVGDTPEPHVAYVRGDAERLPFRPAVFDAVCCFAALHLFADPWAALDEMARVLAPGGRIAVLTSRRARAAPLRVAETALGAGLGVHMFDADELTAALAERGFVDVRRRAQGLVQYLGGRLANPPPGSCRD